MEHFSRIFNVKDVLPYQVEAVSSFLQAAVTTCSVCQHSLFFGNVFAHKTDYFPGLLYSTAPK